jgi:hypothetical protein
VTGAGSVTQRAEFELDGTDRDYDAYPIQGLAGDVLYELHRMIEDHGVTRLRVTLEWEGDY